jgi:polar amino acid transport system substrate-binding protein
MKSYFMPFVLLVFMTVCTAPVSAGEKVKLATTEWKPYIGKTLKNQGYVAELVIEAFKRSGKEVEIIYVPWARAVKMAGDKVVDGYLPEYYSDSLKEHYLVSEPVPCGPLGFFKRKGDAIGYKSLKDLKPYKIGVVRGYINTAEFDAATYLRKDEATDDLINLKKLINKRVDLVVCDQYVGQFILQQDLKDQAKTIEFISPPLEEKKLYLCITKGGAHDQANIKAFNEGLLKMKHDGTVNAIMKKNGF